MTYLSSRSIALLGIGAFIAFVINPDNFSAGALSGIATALVLSVIWGDKKYD